MGDKKQMEKGKILMGKCGNKAANVMWKWVIGEMGKCGSWQVFLMGAEHQHSKCHYLSLRPVTLEHRKWKPGASEP